MTTQAKYVLITGANRGIGLQLATQYQQAGHHVIAVCRNSSAELDALGCYQVITGIDVSDFATVETLVSKLTAPQVDILINNAGILRSTSLDNFDFGLMEEQIQVNTLSPLKVVEQLLPKLVAGSKIAMVTSRMGSIADNTSGGSYGYRMSKAALNIASVSLAHDLKEKEISVALLHPGFVQTEMVGGMGDITASEAASRLIKRIDELNLSNTGSFWHSNGEILPW